MTKVLHFVTDYPGSHSATTTAAVKNLIEATNQELEHVVVMVDREKGFFWKQLDDHTFHLSIPRLKFGILNTTFSFIAFLIFALKFNVIQKADVVHCHKLTIDGVFGYFVHVLFGKPYVISVRGASDEKWIVKKFYTRFLFKLILKNAQHLFYVSAFMKPIVKARLGIVLPEKSSALANISGCDFSASEQHFSVSNKVVFIGRLSIWKSKGVDKLISALVGSPELTLEIIGAGDEQCINEIKSYAEAVGCKSPIIFHGAMANSEIRARLPQYACLAMPSYPETFGMAYVEALNANVPVLTSQRGGISGYLSDKMYIEVVDDTNVTTIRNSLLKLVQQQLEIKHHLQSDMSTLVALFSDNAIAQHYIATVNQIRTVE